MTKLTLVIVAVVLVFIAILGAAGLGYRALVISRQFETAPLVQLDKDLVNEIAMSFRGDPPILIRRDSQKKWRMEHPIHGPANVQNTLITRETLFEMQIQRRYKPKDPDCPTEEESGVNQPRALVRLRTSGGDELEFSVLNFVPRRKETYIQVKGSNELLSVSPDPMAIIAKPFGHYRDNKLVDLSEDDLAAVTLLQSRGRHEYNISKESGQWHISSQDNNIDGYRVREEAVEGLLKDIAAIEVCGFLPEPINDPAQFSMDVPWQSYHIAFGNGLPAMDIDLIIHAGGMFSSVNGEMWPVQIRPEDGRAAIREPGDLINRQLFSFRPAEIIEVHVHGDIGSKSYSRSASKWQCDGEYINSQRFEHLLQSLCELKFESSIRDYASLSGFGLETPQMSVDIMFSDGRSMTIDAGSNSPAAGRIYLKCSDRPSVFTVSGAIMGELSALQTQ